MHKMCGFTSFCTHAQGIIRAFALHLNILQYQIEDSGGPDQMILFEDSEGSDQTAWMRRLTWAFAVRICPKNHFRMARPN